MNNYLLPFLLCAIVPATGFAQGSLTPPGPPAATMKRLDQVEARIIVNGTNTPGDEANTFIISQPGSYYLTGNTTGTSGKHGISIRANDVTLDLNGFALISGGGGAFRGVDVPAEQSNFSIRNGTVRGWAGGGVRAETVRGVLAEKLRFTGNTGAVGLHVGLGSSIKDCVATTNGIGFQTPDRCQIISCISTENTGEGFKSTDYVSIIDCTASRNGAEGISVGASSLVERCSATRNEFNGIFVSGPSTIANCTASNNKINGIFAFSPMNGRGSTITNCNAANNEDAGIAAGPGASVTNSAASGNGATGIEAQNGVVAFCRAANNNQRNLGSTDILATGSTRTGNNPTP